MPSTCKPELRLDDLLADQEVPKLLALLSLLVTFLGLGLGMFRFEDLQSCMQNV